MSTPNFGPFLLGNGRFPPKQRSNVDFRYYLWSHFIFILFDRTLVYAKEVPFRGSLFGIVPLKVTEPQKLAKNTVKFKLATYTT